MELLAFGDPHLKPVEGAIDYEKLRLPADVDAVVTTGDVIHRPEPADIEAGRDFFAHLDQLGVPVIAVPGNHDPHEHYPDLLADCENVVDAHERVVTADDFERGVQADFDDHRFVGWGCEQFNFEPELRLVDYPALDPREGRSRRERRYESDRQAQRLEDALFEFVRGRLDRAALRSELGVTTNRSQFATQLERLVETYETITGLLDRAGRPTVVCTHIPPYNTELDRHHSIGERELDLDGLHVGSIGLKLALREGRPIAALNGHSHNGGYEPGIGDDARPHMLNLDFQGIASLTVDGPSGGFGFEFHHE